MLSWLRFILLAVLIAGWTPFPSARGAQPNIILVMPDDVGYGDYACLGNPIIHTPAVDAFKKQSLLFTQFHVSPTCAPTRAALMSGRHEFKNGVTHTILERERMSLKTYTLAQMLKSAGYTTGIFGKWHLGDEEAYRPENRGFDEVYIHGGGGIGQTFPGSCGDAPGNTNIDPALWHNGKFEKTKGYCTDLFFEQALRWMDVQRAGKQPFFAYIPLNAAHAPLVVPEIYYQQYRRLPDVSELAAKFFGMIENIDANFGRLLQKLEDWKIAENTLVIFLAGDNGGTREHLQRWDARRQMYSLPGWDANCRFLPLAGGKNPGGRAVWRIGRAYRPFPDTGGDRRRETEGGDAKASRGTQLVAAIAKPGSQLGGPHAGHACGPLGERPGGGGEV
jgi:arylsulfatase